MRHGTKIQLYINKPSVFVSDVGSKPSHPLYTTMIIKGKILHVAGSPSTKEGQIGYTTRYQTVSSVERSHKPRALSKEFCEIIFSYNNIQFGFIGARATTG